MRFKKIWLIGLVMLMSLMTISSIHYVDADVTIPGSINPTVPKGKAGGSSAIGFVTPTSIGTGSGQYSSALNWESPTSTQTSATYAVLRPGQSVNVYSRYYYTGTDKVTYANVLQIGNNDVTTSKETTDFSATTQTNVTPLSSSDSVLGDNRAPSNSANVGYKLTAPSDIDTPKWVYFQSIFKGSNTYVGSKIFALLVLPNEFKYNTSLSQSVIFAVPKGTEPTILTATASTTQTITGVDPRLTTTTTSGAGSWSGNTFTPAGVGTTTATYSLPVSFPWPATNDTQENLGSSQTAYIGQLDNQTVSVGMPATFSLQLPSGLVTSDVIWIFGSSFLSGGSSAFTTPAATMEQDGQQVRAIIGKVQKSSTDSTEIAKNVGAWAYLYVNNESLAISTSSPVIYSGSQVPSGSDQSQASATWKQQPTSKVIWSVDDTSLATIDATSGKLTANTTGKTGTVKVTGKYLDGTTTETKTIDVTVARQPDKKAVTTGSSYTLTAPTVSGSTYQWQCYDGATKQWQNISGATDQNYQATAATADDQAQFRVALTNNSNTTTSNPTTLFVNPAGLALLSVPDYYFYTLNSTGSLSAPTADDLIMGKYAGSANINWNDLTTAANNWLVSKSPDPNLDPNPIVVSDASATGFSLSMSMAPFQIHESGPYLTNDKGGSAAIAFGLKDGTNWTQSEVFDDNQSATVLTSGQTDPSTGRATLDYQALLSFNRIPVVRAGLYGSSLTWTLANTLQ